MPYTKYLTYSNHSSGSIDGLPLVCYEYWAVRFFTNNKLVIYLSFAQYDSEELTLEYLYIARAKADNYEVFGIVFLIIKGIIQLYLTKNILKISFLLLF